MGEYKSPKIAGYVTLETCLSVQHVCHKITWLVRGEVAGRVDVECSRRAAMGGRGDHGTFNAGAMGGGVDRVHGTRAARLPLQRGLVSEGVGWIITGSEVQGMAGATVSS